MVHIVNHVVFNGVLFCLYTSGSGTMSAVSEHKILAFVGMPGSGKGTCTSHLAEQYGFPLVHFGNMVYEEVQRRGLDNVENEKFVREDMRVQEGKAVLAKHALRKAKQYFKEGSKTVVFDGLYSWTERCYLAEKLVDDLIVIAVAAPRQERYQRTLNRKDGHRKYTSAQQIMERDIAQIENLEQGGPIAFADYTLVNSGAVDTLITKLDILLADLHITKK